MGNIRPFQIGLLAAFAIVALISVVMLASYQGFGALSTNPYGEKVVIWGTLAGIPFTNLIQEISRDDRNFQVVQYVEKDPRTFEEELVNAIAEGRAPDAIVLDHEHLIVLRAKLQAISYDDFPTRTLRDQYVDGFEVFALQNGLYAIPLAVDPLLMYWNRDLFASGGLPQPPATWEALTDTVEQLTLRDATRNLQQATVAFGEYRNVENAKATLLTLLLQSGSQMISEGQNRYVVALDSAVNNNSSRPLFSTLQFYVEFNNVSSPLYSWNRTFESDQQAFLGERLTLYFGYGSEWERLRSQNPNLNFDAAPVPQGAGATVKRIYGKFYGLSLLTSTPNPAGAYRALAVLGSASNTARLATELSLAPAHRETLSLGVSEAVSQTVYDQALIARGWLDPDPEESDEIMTQMIEDISSGRSQIGGATSDTIRRLELAF
jgi:ABC-type glycerol-3-phosphate transport system substrate-binding protein